MKKVLSRRLFVTYSIMILLLVVFAAAAFYEYNIYTLKTNAKSNLEQLSVNTANQIDTQIRSMDSISIDIATNNNFVAALRDVSQNGSAYKSINETAYKADQSIINHTLIENFVNKYDIYRITVFTTNGDVFSTSEYNLSSAEVQIVIMKSGWDSNINLINGRKIMQSPHDDSWNTLKPEKVISLMRAIRDPVKIIGYIEIQRNVQVLEKICENEWNSTPLKLVIIDGDNKVFYSNFDYASNTKIFESISKNTKVYSSQTMDEESSIISISQSNYTDWKIALILENSILYKPLLFILIAIIIVVIFTVLVATAFIRIVTMKLTDPINNLVKKINEIDIDNLDQQIDVGYVSYEANILQKAFIQMKTRLSESILKEKAMQLLQTKATFIMLQSKIGPHFLFNTLGSIANMCEEGKNDLAADALYNLSDILRYSANYQNSIVKLRYEIENLNAYLLLMKGRYMHRLNFTISSDAIADKILIPKLTLQPIVENAIKYSLIETEKVYIKISVDLRDNILSIKVSDNGCGIDSEKLDIINGKYKNYTEGNHRTEISDEISFGGMGLLGTLLRLYLHYGDNFHYNIYQNPDVGTTIFLSIETSEQLNI
jgi:two-component system sensor histidine kinase YesM